jgi:hypothetical protein
MISFFKFLGIGALCVVAFVGFALSAVILMFFPEWVRWTAAGITSTALVWFFLFGRFRRKSGLLINDGTVYDRWRGSGRRASKEFL